MRSVEERRREQGREGSPVVVGSPMNYGGRHPVPTASYANAFQGEVPMRFGRDPTTHLAGVFGLNSVNYPPASRRNSRRLPSAADYAEKDQRPDQWQLDARKWCSVRLCRLLLSALLRIFAEQSVLRPPFRQGYFLPGGWALALAWGRARGRTRRKEHVEHDQKGLG